MTTDLKTKTVNLTDIKPDDINTFDLIGETVRLDIVDEDGDTGTVYGELAGLTFTSEGVGVQFAHGQSGIPFTPEDLKTNRVTISYLTWGL